MAFSVKQRLFIAAYLETWNATEAARRAGYSDKTARSIGAENLTKPDIQAAIESGIAEIMPKGEVLTRIAARARASIADVLSLPSTEPRPEPDPGDFSAKLAAIQAPSRWAIDLIKAQQTGGIHQIKKLKSGKYGDEIETYDPLPALELLAKHLKMLDDGGILKYLDLSKLTPEQLQRIADGDDPLAVLLNTTTDPGAGPA